MSDGRIRSGRHKGDRYPNTIEDNIELNTKAGDTNLCIRCKEFIPTIYNKSGSRDRSNRVDCDDGEDIVSYHLICYDLELFGHITKTTQKRLDQYANDS